ncbi:hypothetical protein Tco_0853999 [Tanacetum coccineum]
MLVSTTEDEERVKDHLEPQPYLSSSHQAEEEATMAALIQDLITSKARMEADRLLALRLQEEERERAEIERRRLRNEMKSCDPDKKEEGCQEEVSSPEMETISLSTETNGNFRAFNCLSDIKIESSTKENESKGSPRMITRLGDCYYERLYEPCPSGSRSLPSNTIANPRGDLKSITTRSGISYDGPTIPPTSSPLPKEVEREPEATKDKVQTTSTAHVQPPVVQVPIPEPDLAPKPNPKPSIPYPSRINDQKL